MPAQDALLNILNGYAAGDAARVRETLAELLDSGIKPEVVADNLITAILDNPQPIWLGLMDKLTEVSRNAYPNVKLLLALIAPATPVTPAFPVAPAPKPRATIATAVKPVAAPAPKPAPEPEPKPELEPEPTPSVPQVASSADAAEVWNQIILHCEQASPGIVKFLHDADYTYANNKLTIYAKKSFNQKQIDKRRGVIAEVLPEGCTIEVNNQVLTQDADLAAIAELMGGGEEVSIDE